MFLEAMSLSPRFTPVWQIAAKYTTGKNDVREVIYEIRKMNKLDNNANVYPGQFQTVLPSPRPICVSYRNGQ